MAEPACVEEADARRLGRLDDIRERIVRVFESIGGQRGEGLELADRIKPQAEVAAM